MATITSFKPLILFNLWKSIGKLENPALQDKLRALLHRAVSTSSVNEVSIRCLWKIDELDYLLDCLRFAVSYRSGVPDDEITYLCAFMYKIFIERVGIEDERV